jgi:hypothetical protein
VGFIDLTIATLSDTGRVVSKCTHTRAFEVTEPAENEAVIYTTSRRFFVTGDASIPSDYIVFSGKNLIPVASMRLEFVGRPKVDGYKCDVDATTRTQVACFLRNKDIKDVGEFAFVFYDEPGTVLARSEGYFALLSPTAKLHSENPVAVSVPARVSAILSAALPTQLPLELVLVNTDDTVVHSAAQWTGADTVTFVDAVFSTAGAGRIAVRARYLGGDPELCFFSGELTVADGPAPVPVLAAVYPSHLQLSTLSAGVPTVLRLDIENVALIAVRLGSVTVGGANATIISNKGAVYVSALLAPVAGSLEVQAFSKAGKALFDASILTVEDDAHARGAAGSIYVRPGSYAALLSDDGSVIIITDVVNAGMLPAVVSTDSGTVTATECVDKGGYTRFTTTLVGCTACAGRRVVITFGFGGASLISAGYQVIRRPALRRVWPAAVLDFSAGSGCVPFAVTFDEVNPRQVLAVGFPGNPGVEVVSMAVDEATSTFTGCFVCYKCATGTFSAALVAPFTDAESAALIIPATEVEIRATWSPEAAAAVEGVAAGSDAAGRALADHQIILFAFAGAAFVAVLAAVSWRRRGARKQPSELGADLLEAEPSIASV